jgi:hypothetical protein
MLGALVGLSLIRLALAARALLSLGHFRNGAVAPTVAAEGLFRHTFI